MDTVPAGGEKSVWSIDEIKNVLDRESGLGADGGTYWQRNKSGRVAMLCSLLFPGLGQMYNERPLKAILALGIETYYLSQIMKNYRYSKRRAKTRDSYEPGTYLWNRHDAWVQEYKERVIDWVWWSAGSLVVLMVDAYVDAHLHDMKFSVESQPVAGGAGIAFAIEF